MAGETLVMCSSPDPAEFNKDWEKIACLIKDVLLAKVCKRAQVCEVVNLIVKYSQWLSVDKLSEHVQKIVLEYGEENLVSINFTVNDLKGIESFIEIWTIYNKSWNRVEILLETLENRSRRVELNEYNRLLSYKSDDKVILKKNIKHTIMASGEEKIIKIREGMTDSIFKYLKRKDHDMDRLVTLVNQVKSIISELESNLEVKDKEIYKKVFEESYTSSVEKFYRESTNAFISLLSPYEYIKKCIGHVDYELGIVERLLPESVEAAMTAMRNSFIVDHLDVLTKDFEHFLKYDQREELKKVYKLFKESPDAMKALKDHFQSHEKNIFYELRKSCELSNFCEAISTKFNEEMDYVVDVFESNPDTVRVLYEGLSQAINMTLNTEGAQPTKQKQNATSFSQVSDMLVNHCDQFMRNGTKGLIEKALDKKLDDIMFVFRYLEDKDLFSKLYSKGLAKRLINSLSQSLEVEETMINKLKQECGNSYVKGLERMITDVQLSKDLTVKFNEEHGEKLLISMSALIIQSGSWPIQPSKSTLLVPQAISGGMTLFNEFYTVNRSGKKLQWHHGLSICDIKLNYLKKSCTLQTPVTITAIMILFNTLESAAFEEIRTSTDIEAKELLKYLQFLTAQDILSCNDGNNVTQQSTFSLNDKFESKRAKFKLIPVLREAAQESSETTKAVLEERKFYLQALIVRIMKSKKTMTHNDLVSEAIKEAMSHFVPSKVFVKGVIDDLIAKEYLERARGNKEEYNYLA